MTFMLETGGYASIGVDSQSIWIGVTSTGSLSNNQWHHIVGTWAATSGTNVAPSQFNLYVDGLAVSTTNTSAGTVASPLTGLSGTMIGYYFMWGYYFSGSIDEVAIYTTKLTAAQVYTHYNAR